MTDRTSTAIAFAIMAALVFGSCSVGPDVVVEDQGLVPPVVETAPEPDFVELQPCIPGPLPQTRPHSQLIERGVLNMSVLCGTLPKFKTAGRPAGILKVDVVVNTEGTVITAKCDDEDTKAAAAAEKAAKLTYIPAIALGGVLQNVHGVVVYAHSPERGVWLPARMPVSF